MSTIDFAPLLTDVRTCPRASRPADHPPAVVSVLHLINGEHFSGAERVQQLLGKRLPEFGVAADFACLKPGKFPSLCDLSPDRVFSVPMHGRFDREIASRISRLVVANDYNLLHAHTPRSALIASRVASRLSIPWIYHVHSPTVRDSSRQWINRINDLAERYSLRNCRQLITVSRSLRREFLRRGYSRDRLICIPNGVPALEPINARRRHDLAVWRLGMVALFRPRKGLEVLLDALHQRRHLSTAIEVEIIGGFETTEYEKRIRQLVHEYHLESQVRFTGFTSDVPSRLRELDGLVLPSLYGEGMPMVVLEALSAAVPVIATKVEGTPEVVRHGIEGLLAEPRDARSLSHAIADFVSDRNRWVRMSDAAINRHRDRFSDQTMADATAALYRRVVSKTPGFETNLEIFRG